MNNIPNGSRFAKLTLEYTLPKLTTDKRVSGLWRCDCGEYVTAPLGRVRCGYKTSCGCDMGAKQIVGRGTHGGRYKAEYKNWLSMRRRCENPTDKDYPRWGGRGVTVCSRWQNFALFLADVGAKPSRRHSLDRFPDANGNYEPGNVRWATPLEQARNKRKPIKLVSGPLGILPVRDYARLIGLTAGALHMRMRRQQMPGCLWL